MASAAVLACAPAPEAPTVHVIDGRALGTSYTVKVVGELPPAAREAAERAGTEALAEVDAKMSTYRQDSELSRFNGWTAPEPMPVSAELAEVMTLAGEISAASGGAFDVTVGPLVDAWGFGPAGPPETPPAPERVAQLRQRVGFARVAVTASPATLAKERPDVEVDLSAIAKGYAVDRIAEGLGTQGLERFMVEVGGEVRTAGVNHRGEPWRIGVEQPSAGRRLVQRVVPLSGESLATSGDYRNFYERDGRRYSHTLDPVTGAPVTHTGASVSVVAERCAAADAWATALLVLGPERGLELAAAQNIAALFLVHEEDGGVVERLSPALEEHLERMAAAAAAAR